MKGFLRLITDGLSFLLSGYFHLKGHHIEYMVSLVVSVMRLKHINVQVIQLQQSPAQEPFPYSDISSGGPVKAEI